jgi:choline-sulfatase
MLFSQENLPLHKKPNIIFILTDQQHAKMMSCAENKWVKTPAMDYLAQNGIRFKRAYATNPVCSPARVSMMTGRFPASFNDNEGNPVKENFGSMRINNISEEVLHTTIASFVSKAGYELVYGGKEHLPKQLVPSVLGFNDISDNEREELAKVASNFIKSDHKKPYFLVVSLINPHDICYMAIRDFAESGVDSMILARGAVEVNTLDKAMQMPEGVTEAEFYKQYAPPLPPNYEPQKDEPKAISWLLNTRSFREQAREKYTDKNWRMHRWAYSRLTEMVDQEVQMVLDALKESGQEENTLVIFSSDHGDNDASHRMEHKTTLYEESANVPFIAMWKGHIPAGQVDDTHLVSVGLDLLPTVSDYAGVKGEADPRGRSLRPLFEGEDVAWRKTLGVESEIGRMVVTEDRFKYIRYDADGIEEQLLDLNKDPHETNHYTNVPEYQTRLAELRKIFDHEWFPEY